MTRAEPEPNPLQGVALVTGNLGKLAEARRLCGAELEAVEMDLPEIQSLDLIAVLRAKGEEASRRLQRPLIVEETGLELAAMAGFPGPLVKWMLGAVGAEGIARAAIALGDDRVTARCALFLLGPGREVVAVGETRGRVSLPPRGDRGFGWDPIFVPDGQDRTYAQLRAEEKDLLSHRGRAWRALLQELAQPES
jgi:non-canonical purine NTP pyrophosphatase (RdgB/HAM1 family)